MPGNAQKIIAAARTATQGARLVLTPELSICGYPAEDLFLRAAFIAACDDAVKTVARELAGLKGLHVVVGHPTGGDIRSKSVAVQRRFNAASVLQRGPRARDLRQARAAQLPGVRRAPLFRAGPAAACVFEVEGVQRRPADLRGRLVRGAGAAGQGGGRRGAGCDQRLAVPRGQGRRARTSAWRDRAKARAAAGLRAPGRAARTRWCSTARSFALDADGALAARAPRLREDLLRRARSREPRTAPRCAARWRRAARSRRRPVRRAGAGRARLHRQERLSRRAAGPVGRHRFGAGAGDRASTRWAPSGCAR